METSTPTAEPAQHREAARISSVLTAALALALAIALPWLVPAGSGGPGFIAPARAAAAHAHQSAGGGASGLRQGPRRVQKGPAPAPRADRRQAAPAEPARPGPLPRPRQGDQHLQGPHRRAAVAHRPAQQVRRAARLLRCRHRAADRGILRPLQDHAGAARQRAALRHARSRTSSTSARRSRAPRASMPRPPTRRAASAWRCSTPRPTATRTSATRAPTPTRAACRPAPPRTATAAQVGGPEAEDRRGCARGRRPRRQGGGARRQGRPALQSLDRRAQRPDERARRAVRADPGDRADAPRPDRPDEILRAHPDHPEPDAGRAQLGDVASYKISDARIMGYLRNNSVFTFGKTDRAKKSATYREILDAMFLFNSKFEKAQAKFDEIKAARTKGREGALEPHVRDAPSVAAQVVEADKSVEVIHDDGGDRLRFRQPQIDGDAAAAVLAGSGRPPIGYAAAVGTEMKAERSGVPAHRRGSAPTPGSVRPRSHRPRAPRSAGRPCNCRPWPTPGARQNSSGPRRKDKTLRSSQLTTPV